ncbi:Protein Wnt-2 [Amphibalanus amphitrite]|uniref:Protein Wnt n=1 Tax=Amphibalanus amphitrite TaxID=1232801 RepID=A0A6A4W7M1_AMPAM|nr:Protein Wnt-2 [Amphibalanus amphitrite]
MRPVITALLAGLSLAVCARCAAARGDRLQGCQQVCQDSLVPCGSTASSSPSSSVSSNLRRRPSAPSCRRVQGLTRRQRVFCRRHPDMLSALLDGVRRGTKECRRRFRHDRWNCQALTETAGGRRLDFGHVLVKGTPETAVWYALHSAAITHALYRACRRGELRACSCGPRRGHSLERWKWGCQRGLKFSVKKARKFVNSREVEQDARSKMNVHNNKVGIRLVSRHWRRPARCQLVSGICVSSSARWRQVPHSFSAIGLRLAAERDRSVLVALGPDGQLREVATGKRPSRRRLVHLEPSPGYCEPDPETGFSGTAGRPCRKNSSAAGSCEDLCCGRGNSTRIVRQVFCCNFHTNSASPSRCRQQTRVRQCN